MPRYFLKSTTITCAKPIQDYLKNPEERIFIANETLGKATDFLLFIANHIEKNELLRWAYPEIAVSTEWTRKHRWNSEEIELPRQGIYAAPTFKALGVGMAAQGYHGTKGYLDDLIGKNAMLSTVVAADTKKWFDNVEELLDVPDISKLSASQLYLIGTNYAPGDIYEQVKESNLGYEWMTVPAEDENGEPTWPEKLSAEEIARMKSDPARCIVFYTQMQNQPMATDLTDFKNDWLKYYALIETREGEPAIKYTDQEQKERVVLIKDLNIRATLDPAYSEGGAKKSARTAIMIVGTHKETNARIVLTAWARRVGDPKIMYKKIYDLHMEYRPRTWGFVVYGPEIFVVKTVRDAMKEYKIHFPTRECKRDMSENSKDIKIRSLQDDFARGDIYIHESMKDFKGEYLAFPMGTTKDMLDALAAHKEWWGRGKQKELLSTNEDRYYEMVRGRSAVTGY